MWKRDLLVRIAVILPDGAGAAGKTAMQHAVFARRRGDMPDAFGDPVALRR